MTQDTTLFNLDQIGQRLDTQLAEKFPAVSRSQLQAWIKKGYVSLTDGTILTTGSLKLKQPITVHVQIPELQPFTLPEPEKRSAALDIIYEDNHLLVINKPVGLTVHPGAGRPNGTLVNMLLDHTNGALSQLDNAQHRPGIVHRLDKDTSGLMVVAKTTHVHHLLAEQLQKRDMKRHYQALLWGLPQPLNGTIDAPIGRDSKHRQRMTITSQGKSAVTHYTVLRAFSTYFSHVECRLETGRTHQIRVHMASIGHPLLGDHTYTGRHGRKTKHLPDGITDALSELTGQALFAAELIFTHPITQQSMHFTVPQPDTFRNLLRILKTNI